MVESPGAKMSTQLPQFDDPAFKSALVVDPTLMASGAEPGDCPHASALLFPAAVTTVIPASYAAFTASFISW